jgi:hypothetical protein
MHISNKTSGSESEAGNGEDDIPLRKLLAKRSSDFEGGKSLVKVKAAKLENLKVSRRLI